MATAPPTLPGDRAPGHGSDPSRELRRRRWIDRIVLAVGAAMLAASGGDPATADGTRESLFLAGSDPHAIWRQTIDVLGNDWPIIDSVAPDATQDPPLEGLIRSAWVEPTPDVGGVVATVAPARQRLVARVRPTADGAWLDAVMETQAIGFATDDVWRGAGAEVVWARGSATSSTGIATELATRLVADADVAALPEVPALSGDQWSGLAPTGPPWAGSRFPRLSRTWHKLLADERHFYDDQALLCMAAAFGAGALMANTGFDTTVQTAWQKSVAPTDLGTFFSGCKDIGEGRYALSVFGVAAATGLVFEGQPGGDLVGEWGSRSLRMFVVGAAPVYILQMATGASRPGESSAGSRWHFFNDNNGVSGHAFVGAIPFLAAADMVESPWAKGGLYVCSTFVAFSRINDNAHYPSQAFLGWYLAWASAVAVDRTEWQYAGMDIRVVPLPMADLGGMALEARW